MEEPERQRLFIALPVSRELTGVVQALPRGGLDAPRWLPADDLHITLRFLGDVDASLIPDLQAVLARIRRPSFELKVSGLGFFDTGREGVLWAVPEGVRKITALAADINEALQGLGFDMPRKPFIPHITLARTASARGLAAYAEKHGGRIRAGWQVDEFLLYRSGGDPVENASNYSVVARFALAGGFGDGKNVNKPLTIR